jgi:hypothetical protein
MEGNRSAKLVKNANLWKKISGKDKENVRISIEALTYLINDYYRIFYYL